MVFLLSAISYYRNYSTFNIFLFSLRIGESGRALWKFTELSQHSNGGIGSLRGRFQVIKKRIFEESKIKIFPTSQLKAGPGSQGTIAAQFNCEGTTLSGVDFELAGPGYRLSLVKRRFVSGTYTSRLAGDLLIAQV